MSQQPIPLTPEDVRILNTCPLHYHFLRQKSSLPVIYSTQAERTAMIHDAIQNLHAAGGPSRLSLKDCLKRVADEPVTRHIIENYYHRLEHDWSRMIAGNETMTLKISIGGVALALRATLDRLDKTSDGGILAIVFRTGQETHTTAKDLRRDPATTIYHALVASTYPLKRPVRIQELWLHPNKEVTVELSEDEYRQNLGRLREPVKALARGEVMARPGLHCDVCPFKHQGCPVYAQDTDADSESDDFVPPAPGGKISPRKWIFKI